VGLIPLLGQLGFRFFKAQGSALPSGFASVALFSLLANGTSALGRYGDVLILDHFSADRVSIGYYSLATTFVLAAIQVTATVQAIVTPYFSEHAQDEAWVRGQLVRNQLRMAALSVLVALGVYVLAWVIVPWIYGPSYRPTLTYLSVLLLRYVVWSSCAVIGAAFVGLGLMRYNFIVGAISTSVGLVLSYLLLQIYGIVGVAWAKVVAAILTFVLVVVIGRIALRREFAAQKAGHHRMLGSDTA
jgi:O-antigen/teichoic acid export membrane protein